ncbi:MAG: DUF4347 domain-containing protein [Thalassobaculaceae bacterium]
MTWMDGGNADAVGRTGSRPVLVVDYGVKQADLLTGGLAVEADILFLVPGRRALDQIAAFLADRRDIPSLHILSHGHPGVLALAGSKVDLAALVLQQDALATIAAALADDAAVVLYGCSVLAGPKGAGFSRYLALALDAEVSGSLMPVGSLEKGGDWVLRNIDGLWIEPIFTGDARARYPELLVTGARTANRP